ncbi:MAG TPA: Zn-dependent protease [Phycisphaerales bacterium]|nr:Zn-dependent protease [Phycisphaerales bacterium]
MSQDSVRTTDGAGGRRAPEPLRPVATYSIVARDGRTGELGVAVQSHWFSVGTVVPWAEAGVGAVATQSLVDPKYGPEGLRLMREGRSASEALAVLLAADEGRELRQVAMVDAQGRAGVHTGARCIGEAGDDSAITRDGSIISCQANLMRGPSVPEALKRGFDSLSDDAPLAERLLMALKWAERSGGDVRGKQSAAILVVAPQSTGQPWKDRLVDLHVEDHPAPLDEMTRLLRLHRAYERMNKGDEAMEKGDIPGAVEQYSEARRLAPGNAEMSFWAGVALVNAGKIAEGEPLLAEAFSDKNGGDWRTTLRRLPRAGLLPDDQELIERLARLPAAD